MISHDSLLEIKHKYQCFLLDIWGVIHASGTLFPNVLSVTKALMDAGKKVVLLSNAPRRAKKVQEFLENMGVMKGVHYHDILTSGEVFFRFISKEEPCKVFHLGPQRDVDICLEATQISMAGSIEDDFKFAIVTGIVEGYERALSALKARGMRLICVNPDIFVTKSSGETEKCAGFIAKEYEKMGGEVTYYGKPYPEVFECALELLSQISGREIGKSEVIMVGDGMETDIEGAAKFGIDSCLCLSGLPSIQLAAGVSLGDFLEKFEPIRPKFAVKHL